MGLQCKSRYILVYYCCVQDGFNLLGLFPGKLILLLLTAKWMGNPDGRTQDTSILTTMVIAVRIPETDNFTETVTMETVQPHYLLSAS